MAAPAHRAVPELARDAREQLTERLRPPGMRLTGLHPRLLSAWLLRARGQSGDVLAEVNPAEAVLFCAVCLGIPVAGVVGEVLSHHLVGVEPDLGQPQPAGFVLSQGEQPRACAARRRDGRTARLSRSRWSGCAMSTAKPMTWPWSTATHACPSRTAAL